jgi:pyridoxine kinase
MKYVCDPVMGDTGKLYVPSDMIDLYRTLIVPKAYMITPN